MRAENENLERRHWLIHVGRGVILTGLSVLSIDLVNRKLKAECIEPQSPCPRCGVYTQCGLPRANESRQATEAERSETKRAETRRSGTRRSEERQIP
jgi:hypothetical protein